MRKMQLSEESKELSSAVYGNWSIASVTLVFLSASVLAISWYRFPVKKKSFPSMKCSKTSFYFLMFASMLRRAGSAERFLIIVLEMACALCVLFEKQRIIQFHLAHRSFIFLFKPETVENVLSSSINIDKSGEYDLLKPWLGTGLLTSGGKKWHTRRKLLTPAFHFQILKSFIPIFNEQSNILVSKLHGLHQNSWTNIVPLITSCTLDVINETAMGVTINAQSGGCKEYVQATKELCSSFFHRVLRPWLLLNFMYYCSPSGRKFKKSLNIVHSFTRKVIKDKKREMLNDNLSNEKKTSDDIDSQNIRKPKPFLELLLEHHFKDASFTEEDIREEVDTFMFEGHDTTAMAISWALYCVGLDKNVQNQIHKETDAIFKGDSKRDITREDLADMKYLECVIKEALRLYPSVPFIARKVVQSFDVLGFKVEPGNIAFIFPWMIHRDSESFPQPEKFNPERFFPENVAQRHPYAYVPFSAGPRNCIGQKFALMEEKTILANIFRNFTVTSKYPIDKINVKANLVIRNYDPLEMRFTSRHALVT